jgi:hypothetical protein
LAVAHQGQTVGNGPRAVNVVGHDHRRYRTFLLQSQNQVVDLCRGDRI